MTDADHCNTKQNKSKHCCWHWAEMTFQPCVAPLRYEKPTKCIHMRITSYSNQWTTAVLDDQIGHNTFVRGPYLLFCANKPFVRGKEHVWHVLFWLDDGEWRVCDFCIAEISRSSPPRHRPPPARLLGSHSRTLQLSMTAGAGFRIASMAMAVGLQLLFAFLARTVAHDGDARPPLQHRKALRFGQCWLCSSCARCHGRCVGSWRSSCSSIDHPHKMRRR
jgi:hypothetical protein